MLRDLDEKLKRTYSDEEDDLVKDFYEPVLEISSKYDRMTGDFSSSVLAAVVRGFSHFFFNEGHMRLICDFGLDDADLGEAMEKYESNAPIPPEIEKRILKSLNDFQDVIIKEKVEVLAWLLKENRLEIHFILRNKSRTMYHVKGAIFEDKIGDKIAIMGSLNESWNAVMGNGEAFSAYRSWNDEQSNYIDDEIQLFGQEWQLTKRKHSITYSITDSIKIGILEHIKNKEKEDVEKNIDNEPKLDKIKSGMQDIDLDFNPFSKIHWKEPPQTESYERWLANGRRGILSIATGVGKTLIAIRAIFEFFQERKNKTDKDRLVMIAVHNKDMIGQWHQELVTWLTNPKNNTTIRNIIEIKGGSSKIDIPTKIADIETSYFDYHTEGIIIAWYQTFARNIIPILTKYQNNKEILFIADEVHEMGTQARINFFKLFDPIYRMGLSATPKRYFDKEGTQFILNYFKGKKYPDGVIYEYEISDAIRDLHLSPYEYNPIFCQLNSKEIEKYNNLTKMIVVEESKKKKDEDKIFELKIRRKLILNKAAVKIEAIIKLMKKLRQSTRSGLKYVLIYLEDTADLLSLNRKLIDNDFNPKYIIRDTVDRDKIISDFRLGTCPVLLAIDILDQGINIPELRIGIISSSTGNEKQYIQRRGRLLRIDEDSGKEKAIIYDLIIPFKKDSGKIKFISSEIFRANIFIKDSINQISVKKEFGQYCDAAWEEIESVIEKESDGM